jgi:HPt (histidine-containing phosphotransfer) domain-containing protein
MTSRVGIPYSFPFLRAGFKDKVLGKGLAASRHRDRVMANELTPTRLAMLRRVGGDKLIRELIDLLLEGTPRKLEAARAALAAGDADCVGRAAHALTSSAGNLGAAEVQQAAYALERCAGGGPGDLAGLLGELEAAWGRARELLAETKRGLDG